MTEIYSIAQIIKNVKYTVQAGLKNPLTLEDGANKRASSSIQDAISNNEIALVQGPPGTGKTTTYTDVMSKTVNRLSLTETFLYIAPTNELVRDMFEKVCFYYAFQNPTSFEKELKSEVRIYGSQFDFKFYEELNYPVFSGVKIIISTNYQRIFHKERNLQFHLLVDEASKSPLHSPFQTLVNSILQEKRLEGSISIVGDPMQAISLSEYYAGKEKRLLMMPYFLRGKLGIPSYEVLDDDDTVLRRARTEIKDGSFTFLDTTFRLPGPSHRGVSNGYYGAELKARNAYSKLSYYSEVNKNILASLKNESSRFNEIGEAIQNAMSTDIGMLLIADGSGSAYENSYKKGLLYDERRGDYGLTAAVVLAAITGKKTAVITTYVQQYLQMQMKLLDKYRHLISKYNKKLDGGDIRNLIEFKTTQSMLGAETENAVLIMGKESAGGMKEKTIYFQEPELFNVQLTRHKKFLVIVGDLTRLYNSASAADRNRRTERYKPLYTTSEVLWGQAGYEKRNRNFRKSYSGNECLVIKISE